MFQSPLPARTLVALAAAGLLLPSCSGGNAVPSGTSAMPQGTQPLSTIRQPLKAKSGTMTALYISDSYGKSVFRFTRNANGTLVTPAGSSLVLSYNPGPIAIGPTSGRLFVTDTDSESVYVYAKDAKAYAQPLRQLIAPFVPSCVAVDKNGYEYVGGFTDGYVAVYAPGANGSAPTLQRIGLPDHHADINGVALDSQGNLYVSDTNEISEFSTPVTNPTLVRAIVGTGQQNTPTGMAINDKNGELYVANTNDNNILVYSATANGKSKPQRTITSPSPPLIGPAGLALSGSVLYSTSGTTLHGPASVFVLDALKGQQAPAQVVTGDYLVVPIGAALGP
jgi:DNA-binding beta-propeller fold protein YncE